MVAPEVYEAYVGRYEIAPNDYMTVEGGRETDAKRPEPDESKT